uniref:Leukocyte cell derived chemotaxin 2 n=1 Tax=Acanthochromis polyacanthus TaxID=80966 RepID=A0A3Q1FRD1_9TELE
MKSEWSMLKAAVRRCEGLKVTGLSCNIWTSPAANIWVSFREDRVHQGLDIECRDGSTVYAPFDVTLDRKVIVYNDPENLKTAINEGIQMRGEGLCFKLFYVRPDRTSGTVRKGERIGTMLPMQRVYPGITSHVHVQMCDRSNPTGYF